jgi:hypothetical protein
LIDGFIDGSHETTNSALSPDFETPAISLRSIGMIASVFAVNIAIVTVVNSLYVSAIVSSQYTFNKLLVIAFFLSLFKIAWNNFLVRGSQYLPVITDNMIVWLSLFNNLLAPLFAEMFVSSDCFLYIVSQAPSLVFNYHVYACQFVRSGFISLEICSVPTLISLGYSGTPVDVSLVPPFHYSYQCSFSLISSYSYVFIFRYIISALIEPAVRMLIYCNLTQPSVSTFRCRFRDLLIKPLPPLWQIAVQLNNALEVTETFKEYLNQFETLLNNGQFRRRLVVLLVTDMTMLVCFGALFPPLAVIIAFSVLKDVISTRLALGRYCEIMEAIQDECLKERMVKIKESMNNEILKAGAEMLNGLWCGMVLGTWIWAFVLFDTMASSEGVWRGIAVLTAMILCPFVFHWAMKFQKLKQNSVLMGDSQIEMKDIDVSVNPIHDDHF